MKFIRNYIDVHACRHTCMQKKIAVFSADYMLLRPATITGMQVHYIQNQNLDLVGWCFVRWYLAWCLQLYGRYTIVDLCTMSRYSKHYHGNGTHEKKSPLPPLPLSTPTELWIDAGRNVWGSNLWKSKIYIFFVIQQITDSNGHCKVVATRNLCTT